MHAVDGTQTFIPLSVVNLVSQDVVVQLLQLLTAGADGLVDLLLDGNNAGTDGQNAWHAMAFHGFYEVHTPHTHNPAHSLNRDSIIHSFSLPLHSGCRITRRDGAGIEPRAAGSDIECNSHTE